MREKNSFPEKASGRIFFNWKYPCKCSLGKSESGIALNGAGRGLGVTALSREFCRESLAKGTLAEFQIENTLLEWEFYAIYHQNKFLTNRMQDFIELCIEWGKNPAM